METEAERLERWAWEDMQRRQDECESIETLIEREFAKLNKLSKWRARGLAERLNEIAA